MRANSTGGCRRACCFDVAEVELFYAHRRGRDCDSRLGQLQFSRKDPLKKQDCQRHNQQRCTGSGDDP
jgi:hypothetical protein